MAIYIKRKSDGKYNSGEPGAPGVLWQSHRALATNFEGLNRISLAARLGALRAANTPYVIVHTVKKRYYSEEQIRKAMVLANKQLDKDAPDNPDECDLSILKALRAL